MIVNGMHEAEGWVHINRKHFKKRWKVGSRRREEFAGKLLRKEHEW